MSHAAHVTGDTFESEVVSSQVPVLIDFYADWCGPCRMMGPILDRVAAQVAGRAKVVKINVDDEPELATHFQVSSIPALVLMHQGKVLANMVGVTPAERLVAMIDKAASPAAARS